MSMTGGGIGLALGIWGAVQASAAGAAVALGGLIRDAVSLYADATSGYVVVYHIEIALLFATLIAIGPLVRIARPGDAAPLRLGVAGLPATSTLQTR